MEVILSTILRRVISIFLAFTLLIQTTGLRAIGQSALIADAPVDAESVENPDVPYSTSGRVVDTGGIGVEGVTVMARQVPTSPLLVTHGDLPGWYRGTADKGSLSKSAQSSYPVAASQPPGTIATTSGVCNIPTGIIAVTCFSLARQPSCQPVR